MFDGETYEQDFDETRLRTQFDRAKHYMSDNQWHTIEEIREQCGGTPQSVSARIRDFRKAKFGGWVKRPSEEG